jgi:hypothetical protein
MDKAWLPRRYRATPSGWMYTSENTGRFLGAYPGPGGAENLVIAPARFGPASRWAVLSIDQTVVSGRVLAVGPHGRVRELADGLGNGVNPIAVIRAPPKRRPRTSPRPGLYVADTLRKGVYVATAADLRPYVNTVVVGTELTADFWTIRSTAAGYRAAPLPTSLERTPPEPGARGLREIAASTREANRRGTPSARGAEPSHRQHRRPSCPPRHLLHGA